jgi:hypothetical protein
MTRNSALTNHVYLPDLLTGFPTGATRKFSGQSAGGQREIRRLN